MVCYFFLKITIKNINHESTAFDVSFPMVSDRILEVNFLYTSLIFGSFIFHSGGSLL